MIRSVNGVVLIIVNKLPYWQLTDDSTICFYCSITVITVTLVMCYIRSRVCFKKCRNSHTNSVANYIAIIIVLNYRDVIIELSVQVCIESIGGTLRSL